MLAKKNWKRRHLAIRGILIDGEWVDDPIRVKHAFYHHFTTRFEAPNWSRAKILDEFPNRLSSEQSRMMGEDVSYDEVKMLSGLFLTSLRQILANRLALEIDDLVSMEQSTFIKGRQILDGPYILNEAVALCKRNKQKSMVFKIDFQKAFDSVRWDFIDDILHRFGFGEHWRKWIQGCFTSCMGQFLLMDLPLMNLDFNEDCDKETRCLHFFLLVMESLHVSVQKIVERGLLLQCFYMASCLNVSFYKSTLLGIVVPYHEVECMASNVGCKSKKVPFNYLDVKIGENMSRIESWKEEKGLDLMEFCQKKVGDGQGTRFWLDKWVGDQTLKEAYSRIFALELDKEIKVAVKLEQIDGLDKLPTRMNLDVRGFDVPSILCPICGEVTKNSDHFFFQCSFVSQVDELFGGWWDIRIPSLSTLHFLKLLENKLESLKLLENQPGDELVPLSI
ncbi:RNA-directed DNA polymerase, eukaryota [Tanacetum coccineum]